MDFIDERLLNYCEHFSEQESGLLKEINRETHIRINSPRMLSGHLQGRFLSFISCLAKPSQILEIGTYTGYSALCLAEGLDEKGRLITIDPNEETNHFAGQFIGNSPYADRIEIITGLAQEVLPRLDGPFDLVFIDADKRNYSLYFDLIIDKLNKGGLIVADNVLWSGKVLDDQKDADTQSLHVFNQKVRNDSRVRGVMLPIRDGIMLLRKL